MNVVRRSLEALRLGAPQSHRNLAVFPLLCERPHPASYCLLDEALAAPTVRLTETSEGGTVRELRLRNEGKRPVLLVDGEELIGAKQNRVVNLSMLVAAQAETTIPVSCVEQGRWDYRRRDFAASGRTMFAAARSRKMARVSETLRARGVASGDQRQVWSDIGRKLSETGTRSATQAMADVYAAQHAEISTFADAFHAEPGQVGAVFALDGQAVGLDYFDAEETFARFLRKLVGSYALDALRAVPSPASSAGGVDSSVRALLHQLGQAIQHEYQGIGVGTHVRLQDPQVAGGALVVEGHIIHLTASRTVTRQTDDRSFA